MIKTTHFNVIILSCTSTVYLLSVMNGLPVRCPYRPINFQCLAPVDEATRKLIWQKPCLWTQYTETRDATKYNEYCKCRNKL